MNQCFTSAGDRVSIFQIFHLALVKDKLAETIRDLQESFWNLSWVQCLQIRDIVWIGWEREGETFPRWEVFANALSWKVVIVHLNRVTFKKTKTKGQHSVKIHSLKLIQVCY